MIAVVDRQSECRLEIRSATTASVTGELVNDDFASLADKRNRRRKTGKTGPDDVNRAVGH